MDITYHRDMDIIWPQPRYLHINCIHRAFPKTP
jgi:hypothetical protein